MPIFGLHPFMKPHMFVVMVGELPLWWLIEMLVFGTGSFHQCNPMQKGRELDRLLPSLPQPDRPVFPPAESQPKYRSQLQGWTRHRSLPFSFSLLRPKTYIAHTYALHSQNCHKGHWNYNMFLIGFWLISYAFSHSLVSESENDIVKPVCHIV